MKEDYKFILVEKSILDYSEYKNQVQALKRQLKHCLIEQSCLHGFELTKDAEESYADASVQLNNREIDLVIEINIKKANEETFV